MQYIKINLPLHDFEINNLREYQRRYNAAASKQGDSEITLEEAAGVLLYLALAENPAAKHYPNCAAE